MPDLTLEALAARLAVVEDKLGLRPPAAGPVRDWRAVAGAMEDNEFTRAVLAEIEANSEAERRAAQEDPG